MPTYPFKTIKHQTNEQKEQSNYMNDPPNTHHKNIINPSIFFLKTSSHAH